MDTISKFGLIIDPAVVDKFLPYIGATAYAIYSFYLFKYNPEVGGAYPSLETTARHIGCDKRTVMKCNDILVQFGLIGIKHGRYRLPNLYIPLKPDIGILRSMQNMLTL